jgi:hypothetical protein
MATYWEKIDNHTTRLKVPGGWVLKSVTCTIYSNCDANKHKSDSSAVHQVFIADKNHEWSL